MFTPLEVYGRGYSVACESPLACMNAARILERGGNAVDASISMALSLAVTIPHLGGVGGDMFALNGSGHSPRALTLGLIKERGGSRALERGPLSVTVPGLVGALYELWKR